VEASLAGLPPPVTAVDGESATLLVRLEAILLLERGSEGYAGRVCRTAYRGVICTSPGRGGMAAWTQGVATMIRLIVADVHGVLSQGFMDILTRTPLSQERL